MLVHTLPHDEQLVAPSVERRVRAICHCMLPILAATDAMACVSAVHCAHTEAELYDSSTMLLTGRHVDIVLTHPHHVLPMRIYINETAPTEIYYLSLHYALPFFLKDHPPHLHPPFYPPRRLPL